MYLNELIKSFIKPDVVAGILGGGIFTVILAYVAYLFKTKQYIDFYLKSKLLALRKKNIRFSISYLFKIEIEGKYLLIRGNKIPDQFQPVGGVFKYYSNAQNIFEKYGVVIDDNIPIDASSNKDLRVKVKAKNAYKFLEWFNSRKNREVCIKRELEEELIMTQLVPKKVSEEFKAEYIKTHFNGIKYSEHFQCDEVLIAEIYNLRLDNNLEKDVKKYLESKKDKRVVLASREEIEKKCIMQDKKLYTISKTSEWTI